MTPDLKTALAAQDVIDEYNKTIEPRIIDPVNYTDLGNAKRFCALHERNIKYVPAWKCWMIWSGARWVKKDNSSMISLVDEMITSMMTEANTMTSTDESEKLRKHAKATEAEKAIMATIRLSQGQPGIIAEPSDFDKNPWLLNLQNGTYNILARRLQEHTREDLITKISPVIYDAGAKCELWVLFMNRIMKNNPEMVAYLQNLSGQCLTGEVREKAFYIFWGAGGDNGKTTFIEQIQYILEEYAQSIPINALIKENKSSIPVDLHSLKGARFAFASEPDLGDTLTDGLIKRITGKDTMKTRTLHEKPQQWKPEFKLVIATNSKPKIPDASGAMWGRVKCIPFTEKIPLDEQDRTLGQKLILISSGILNWMLDGCFAWLDRGMQEPALITQTINNYREDSDKLADWFNYCFDKNINGFVPFRIYYPLYKLWCDTHDTRAVSENTLPGLLENRGYTIDRGWYYNSKGIKVRDRGVFGFQLNSWWTGTKNDDENKPTVEGGQTSNASGASGQTYTINPVHLVLEAVDSDYNHAKWLFGQVDRDKLVDALGAVKRQDITSIMPTLSTLSHDSDIPISTVFSNSVQSVHSVQKDNKVIIKIKALFEHINKPDTINELNKLKENVVLDIMCDSDYDDVDEEQLNRVVDDYYHARGWQ